MTKFDSESIKNKIIERLNQDKNWQAITNNSAITALINSQAEASAEIARYAEYLFKESRWDTAQNESSILSMANMLGYQPKRKISATGKLRFCADDQVLTVGSATPFETFNNWCLGKESSLGWKDFDSSLTFAKGMKLSINNIPFLVAKEATTSINSKYIDVNVIQGEETSLILNKPKVLSTYSESKLNAYIYIPFYCSDVEDASNELSNSFLSVKVMHGSTDIEYRIVENLLLSTSSDRDCELYNDLYSRNLFYLKFRKDNNSLNLLSSSFEGIKISYIRTLGAKGNIDSLYKNCKVVINKTPAYGINITVLNNGYDEEDITSIKDNTISYYRNFYSIGTKENYEKAILKCKFSLEGSTYNFSPSKVKVFSDSNRTKTIVSFLANELEDSSTLVLNSTSSKKDQLTSQLNKYLGRLKSPQDVIEFVYPKYYTFGIKCKCKTKSDNTASISSAVQTYISNLWGSNSSSLDFDRDFIAADITYSIRNEYSSLVSSIDIDTLEAVTQIDWNEAIWDIANTSSSQTVHSCKMPFSFSSIFSNKSLSNKCFDLTKHKYALRIDLLFRSNNNSLTRKYNKTFLFKLASITNSNPDYLYLKHNPTNVWNNNSEDNTYINNMNSYQLPFQIGVLSDSDFSKLEAKIDSGLQSIVPTTDSGSINDFILLLNNTYNTVTSSIDGYFNVAFDPLYRTLQVLSLYDNNLSLEMKNVSLSLLQCGTANTSFNDFRKILSKYLTIYISVTIDKDNIELEDSETSTNLLCIDSHDSNSSNIMNLSEYKKNRFITVESDFEE